MNKREQAVIKRVIDRLDSGRSASPAVQQALENPDLRIWLDCSIIPSMRLLLDNPERSSPGQKRYDRKLAEDLLG